MRSMKQVVVAIATGGLLVAGGTIAGISLTQGTARADPSFSCLASVGSGSQCQLDDISIPDPSGIYVQLTSPSGGKALNGNLTWTVNCPSTSATAVTGSAVAAVPSDTYLDQGIDISSSESCTVTVTLQIVNFSSDTQNVALGLDYNEATGTGSTATPTPTPTVTQSSGVPSGGVSGVIKGFDGKCVDDAGNSSSLRAEVQSWACNNAKAQVWRYASGMLVHNGLCLNDKGNAGNGGKLILYTCQSGPDELFVHQLNNTFEVKAHNWTLCITIPGASKKNGVQLLLDTCRNSADQHWGVP
jgi:hypothetical protein